MRVVGILLAVVVFVMAILMGSSLWIFQDFGSLAFLAAGLLVPAAVHGGAVLKPFEALFGELPEAERAQAGAVLRDLERSVVTAAALATVVRLVQLLCNFGDPNAVGPLLTLLPLPFFYALALRLFVWQALEARLRPMGRADEVALRPEVSPEGTSARFSA